MNQTVSVPLILASADPPLPAGSVVPCTAGIPLPRGAAPDGASWRLLGSNGADLPAVTRTAARWPDGSVRWLTLDAQVTAAEGSQPLTLTLGKATTARTWPPEVHVRREGNLLLADTGTATFVLDPSVTGVIARADTPQGSLLSTSSLVVRGESGAPWQVEWGTLEVEDSCPLRAVVAAAGMASDGGGGRLVLRMRLEFHAGLPAVRVRLVVRNPRRAAHPGGIWELGDAGSQLLREVSLELEREHSSPGVLWSVQPGAFAPAESSVRIHQDSSGGDNWASSNHVNRAGHVSTRFRGYRVEADGTVYNGLRAEPSVVIGPPDARLGVAVPSFWQNFPRSVAATPSRISVAFFPEESEPQELQGGEQKSHECWVICGGPDAQAALTWCHAKPVLHTTPEWYSLSGAIPFLVPATSDDPRYRALVDAAIEGPDTFVHKRESADEYGWRHFGDIYGDHEAVFHHGATPLMSHYNNQYDPVAGLLTQFMRTGDLRWWTQGLELAAHVVDIDLYHTDEDRAAYNHGLFWHTAHYVDAGKANHRTYPSGTNGGGPSSEQNYATGLRLVHLITGDVTYRDAAVGLAEFVLAMDDGDRTVFRWLARGDTGVASASRTPDYQGPGRGSGNSISALVDGHQATGDRRFLAKAEQLIRRCTHPDQDISRLGLLDPENRWFYTMHLQAVARYLEWKDELGEADEMYAYGRDVLLHFARWMADHERPYLDRPDLLEYPTETWPAQDIRKSEVFDAAARYATGAERERFLERAAFFYNYSVGTLAEMPTRSLARPVVLLLSHGCRRAHATAHGVVDAAAAPSNWRTKWPAPEVFVPQKTRAIRRVKLLAALGGLAFVLSGITLAWWLTQGT